MTSIPYGCSFDKFLMNLFAWFWGSIIKGHLLVLSMIIPFYVELSSFGSYAMFHACIFTGSPKYSLMLVPSVWGRSITFSLPNHSFCIYSLKALVNGPEYATIPAEIIESPGSKSIFFSKDLISPAHLIFYSLKP